MKSVRIRNALIITACTVIGFIAGGGYRLLGSPIDEMFVIHHSQGDDLATDIYAYQMMFIFCGGAGAVGGFTLASLAIFLWTKFRKTSPNREP